MPELFSDAICTLTNVLFPLSKLEFPYIRTANASTADIQSPPLLIYTLLEGYFNLFKCLSNKIYSYLDTPTRSHNLNTFFYYGGNNLLLSRNNS